MSESTVNDSKKESEVMLSKEKEQLFSLPHPRRSFIGILVSTFFLRVAFGSTTVLMPIFIWKHLGMEGWSADISVIFVEITYALAVILSSGFFGFKSDASDARKWILFGTAAGGLVLAGYGICAINWGGWIGIIPLTNGLLIFGMSLYHFLHGIAGSCKVNASYGYISRFSVYETRGTRVGFYNVATPFPGTPLYDSVIEKGWLRVTDFDKYDTATPIFETPWLTMKDLKEVRERAFHHFYMRPTYVIRMFGKGWMYGFAALRTALAHLFVIIKSKSKRQ